MSLIKDIEELKSSGKSESEIVADLRERGHMPKEIEDALSQSKVKAAVNQEYAIDPSMRQSVLTQGFTPSPPQNQEIEPPKPIAMQQSQPPQEQPREPAFAPPSYEQPQYSYDQYSPPQEQTQYAYAPSSSESIAETAEQIFDQKIGKIKNEISKIEDFKSDSENKINLLKERVKRIESIIDSLQDSIIRKIGEYGENIQDLGNDLKATQESFSKVVSPLIQKTKSKVTSKKRSKKIK